jgi:DNA-binding NarL/FixJ family response regulator
VLIALLSRQAKQQAIGTLLTPREIEVVGCLLHGRSDKEVGCALGMETGTAHAHVMAIYRKLNVHSRAEICRKLLEHSGCGLGPGSSAIF